MHRIVSSLLVLSIGCGLTQVKGPPPRRVPPERPDCTTSDKLLRVDAGIGAVGVLFTLLGIGLSQSDRNDDLAAIMVIGGLTTTVAMLVSSGVGYSKVKKCRAAVEEYDRVMMQPSYPGYPGQPYPAQPQPPPSQPYPAQPAPAQPQVAPTAPR